MDHVAIFHFTDHLEIRKLALNRFRPIAPERVWHVLPRVHSNTVEAGGADPPERFLNQITRDFRVALIEIREEVEEPAFHHFPLQQPGRAWSVKPPRLKDVI